MVLTALGISKAYGPVRALSDVDLGVGPGEIVGLVGPNGAGKTTLVGVMTGLVRPDAGTVHVDGVDMLDAPGRARCLVSVATQEVGFYPTRRVIDNLVHFGQILGLGKAAAGERAEAVCAALRLTALSRRRAVDLSDGEKRRLHVAIALLSRARVLVLDEPTANVDVDNRAGILDLVRTLAEDGVAVVYATHYLAEIETLGARVVMIDGGQVIASGTVDELVRRHGDSLLEVWLTEPLPAPVEIPGCAVTAEGPCLRVSCAGPAPTMPLVLAALGKHAHLVQSIEVRRPSLELVYLRLRRVGRDAAGGHR